MGAVVDSVTGSDMLAFSLKFSDTVIAKINMSGQVLGYIHLCTIP